MGDQLIGKQSELYNKANSILDLRTDKASIEQVLSRIKDLHTRLTNGTQTLDWKGKIVLTACEDALYLSENRKFWLRDHVIEEINRLRDIDLERYFYYRFRYDVYPSEKIVDAYPPCVQIEPASVCNFRCVFCYQTDSSFSDKSAGHMGIMSLDLFKNIIDQLEGEVESITMASRGEPLIAMAFSEMLKYLSGKFLAVKVNTNASLLDERMCHTLLEADLQTLVFSVDAANELVYKKLRVNGNFKKVLKNIERFVDIKEKHYPKSNLITRISGVAYSEEQNLNEMEKFWDQLVDQVVFVDYNPWENVYKKPVNNIETPCSDLWRRLFVWWDGKINPCDVDYKSMLTPGSVQKTTISDYWQGEFFKNLRQKHLNGFRRGQKPCLGCSVV